MQNASSVQGFNTGFGTQQTAYTYTATQPCTVRSIKLDTGVTFSMPAKEATSSLTSFVVVREGYNANSMVWPAITTDLYNPTMDVLISGVLTDGEVEDHKYNAIGRKLKIETACVLFIIPHSAVVIRCKLV